MVSANNSYKSLDLSTFKKALQIYNNLRENLKEILMYMIYIQKEEDLASSYEKFHYFKRVKQKQTFRAGQVLFH